MTGIGREKEILLVVGCIEGDVLARIASGESGACNIPGSAKLSAASLAALPLVATLLVRFDMFGWGFP